MLAVISSHELKNQDNMPEALELVPTRTIKMIIIKRINIPFGPHRIEDTGEKSIICRHLKSLGNLVEPRGIEPLTSTMPL